MAIYKGKVNCRNLAQLIHNILTTNGYTDVSTEITTDGHVYKSPSTAGEDEFYIKIKDPKTYQLTVGIYEKYTPGVTVGTPGTFTNGYEGNVMAWNYNTHADRFDVDYVINITNKRIIFYVSGQRGESWTINSITYVGLPIRLDPNDKDGSFAGMAYTVFGPYNNPGGWYALRNRARLTIQSYTQDYYLPSRSFGWGENMFFSPIYLGTNEEGYRGILDGLYLMERSDKTYEIGQRDTFVHNGKTYMVVSPNAHGYDTINTGYDYVIEI